MVEQTQNVRVLRLTEEIAKVATIIFEKPHTVNVVEQTQNVPVPRLTEESLEKHLSESAVEQTQNVPVLRVSVSESVVEQSQNVPVPRFSHSANSVFVRMFVVDLQWEVSFGNPCEHRGVCVRVCVCVFVCV